MIVYENRLPADDSHEIPCLFDIFEKAAKHKMSSAENYRWRFVGLKILFVTVEQSLFHSFRVNILGVLIITRLFFINSRINFEIV